MIALVKRVAVDLEPRIHVLEERQGEVADRVLAQIRRHESQTNLAVGRPRRWNLDRRLGRLSFGHPGPDAMLFQKLVAILWRLDVGHLFQERRVATAGGPCATSRGEIADPVEVVERADPHQNLEEDLRIPRSAGLSVQGFQGQLEGLFDIGAFVTAAGSFDAFDQRHQVIHLTGIKLIGLAQVDVAAIAIIVGDGAAKLVVQPARIREPRQQFKEIGLGAAKLLSPPKDDGARLQQARMVGEHGERPIDQRLGLRQVVILVLDADEIQPRIEVVAFQSDRLAKAGHGGRAFALEPKRATELALVIRISGVRPGELCEHSLAPHSVFQIEQYVSAVVQHAGVVGGEFRGLVQAFQGFAMARQASVNDAQQIEQVDIARENLPARLAPFGAFVQTVGAVALHQERAIDRGALARL